MQFDILRNTSKINKIQRKLSNSYKEETTSLGKLVSHSMPALRNPFDALSKVIYESGHRNQYFNIYYYIETKNSSIRQLIPAAEYYKIAFKSISEKLFAINYDVEQINQTLRDISHKYSTTRRVREKTKQPAIEFHLEIYSIKSHSMSFLFNVRSIFDILASLMHFMYNPSAHQFISFVAYIKYLEKTKNRKYDPEMLKYIKSNFEWFWLLRDFRDLITHVSSLDISFYEISENKFIISTNQKINLVDLLKRSLKGLYNYIEFHNQHFIKQIKAQTSEDKRNDRERK